jgi:hypothetical protein
MMKLLPIILFLVGSGAGVGAGLFLRPVPEQPEKGVEDTDAKVEPTLLEAPETPGLGYQYVQMTNQFVVPIVRDQRVSSMMVLSLSIETAEGRADTIYDKEPKLRDIFLQVMFDHANIGGFDGVFTDVSQLAVLRRALREVAQKSLGSDIVNDVLIVDMARQDY